MLAGCFRLANAQTCTTAARLTRKLRDLLDKLHSAKEHESARRNAELECARRELVQRLQELEGKEEQITRRDEEIETLTRELALKGATLAGKDTELAQKEEILAWLQKTLVRKTEDLAALEAESHKEPGRPQPDTIPSGSASANSSRSQNATQGSDRKELQRLQKANRKLTAQVSGQWRIIAALRAQIQDAEQRYDPLYPIEKATVILGAIYDKKLQGKPAVRPLPAPASSCIDIHADFRSGKRTGAS